MPGTSTNKPKLSPNTPCMIRGGAAGDRPATVVKVSSNGEDVVVVPDDTDVSVAFHREGDGQYRGAGTSGEESNLYLDFNETGDPSPQA